MNTIGITKTGPTSSPSRIWISSPRRLWSKINPQGPSFKFIAIESLGCCFNFLKAGHGHKSKTTAFPRYLVKNYLDQLDISCLLEQTSESGAVDAEGKVAHIEFKVRGETPRLTVSDSILALLELRRNGETVRCNFASGRPARL